MKLGQIIGKEEPYGSDVGIEIEVEALLKQTPIVGIDPYWKAKRDGSLRNFGVEYVLTKPRKVNKKLADSVTSICNSINGAGCQVNDNSPRTSVHVHCNMLNKEIVQVWNVMIAYWMLENILMKFCGENSREGNKFCLRIKDAQFVLDKIEHKELSNYDAPFVYLHDNDVRYCGLNTKALRDFGSVEFRGMRGTTDPQLINTWVSELHSLVTNACEFASPDEVMDYYYAHGAEKFIRKFFSLDFANQLMVDYPNYKKLIDENCILLSNICYYHNWQTYTNRINKQFKKVEPKIRMKVPLGGAGWMDDAIDRMALQPRAANIPPLQFAPIEDEI